MDSSGWASKAQEKTGSVENGRLRDVRDVARTQHPAASTRLDVALEQPHARDFPRVSKICDLSSRFLKRKIPCL
jgi:hypothetical protein